MLEHREKRQWTRQRLAVESRVSVSHIRVIEVRRGNPSVLVFVSIALALGVDADKLLREAMQRKAYLDDIHRAESTMAQKPCHRNKLFLSPYGYHSAIDVSRSQSGAIRV